MLQYYIAERCLGYQQITNVSAAVGLTVPVGTTLMLIRPDGQPVRWRTVSNMGSPTYAYRAGQETLL